MEGGSRNEWTGSGKWWTGRDSDPRPSGSSDICLANRTFFGPRKVYQAELPAQRILETEDARSLIAVSCSTEKIRPVLCGTNLGLDLVWRDKPLNRLVGF